MKARPGTEPDGNEVVVEFATFIRMMHLRAASTRKTGLILIVRKTTIRNKLGLHARAASRLVQVSQTFGAAIQICHGGQTANGKSIMSIMLLAATQGTELEIHADGDDESDAVDALVSLIEARFGEEE